MQVVKAHGARIPLIGLGTWDLRGRVCARMVEQALRLGYRHIDTAEMYDNEREVGKGLRAAGVKRNEVFVTTKIWPSHFAPRELERAAKDSLARLRLSEVDLLAIDELGKGRGSPFEMETLDELIGRASCRERVFGYV